MLTIDPALQGKLQRHSYDIVEAIQVIGGTNIQFAHDPKTGRVVVIEINPRTSRSSALASKATGFPIAKIAAKLAIGYTLDEILNDITKQTPACFEPTLDYVVVKAPQFSFSRLAGADPTLNELEERFDAVVEATGVPAVAEAALQYVKSTGKLVYFGVCPPGATAEQVGERLAAKALGLSRSALYRRLQRYGL